MTPERETKRDKKSRGKKARKTARYRGVVTRKRNRDGARPPDRKRDREDARAGERAEEI
jgi:hypothetical protein